ncbi:DUF2690 domain-containing protein [Streptomyces bikiniensis]|uniref:DUF2690 domain-containing protein n=1 Tax=Streptomyces bikiniensis TaxID=1896 RepID=UPI000AFCC64E|nr:DUF2690 domain-containing protein [Streptomyces bikiniensis]
MKCSGADCAGRDPEAMGCGGPLAVTVARVRVGTVGVEVRHSAACSASWARITGAAPGDTVSVEVAGATERATVPEGADTAATETDAYTPMLAVAPRAAARACGTLADGTRACATGRWDPRGGRAERSARTGGSEPDHKGVGIQEGPGRIA